MQNSESSNYQIGVVKWYGGYNRQKQRENDYGFIQGMSDEDIFVHENNILPNNSLNENDLVFYKIQERDDNKKSAIKTFLVKNDIPLLLKFYKDNYQNFSNFFDGYQFQNLIEIISFSDDIKNLNEDVFLKFLNTFSFFDNNKFIQILDDYIIEKDVSENISHLIIENYSKIGSRSILKTENVSKFLASPKIVDHLKNDLLQNTDNELLNDDNNALLVGLDDLSPDEISILLGHQIFPIENFITNHDYIEHIFNHYDENKNVFTILKEESKVNNKVFETISKTSNHFEIFKLIIGRKKISSLLKKEIPLELFPYEYLIENEDFIFDFVTNLEEVNRSEFIDKNYPSLPKNIKVGLIFCEYITDDSHINSYSEIIYSTIENLIKKETSSGDFDEYPTFLTKSFENSFITQPTVFPKNKLLKSLKEELSFKKLLFQKDITCNNVYIGSSTLKTKIDFFILGNIFPLLLNGNDETTTYKIFNHKIWMALAEGYMDFNDDDRINKLFPSCNTMGHLSCEAFYWKNKNIFLCRRKVCGNPQILPDTEKHYLEYNIYDWFHHYNIKYLEAGKPQSREFPIKLAGFFNRKREMFDLLNCRECNNIMIPDFKYARVEYYEQNIETGEIERRDSAAAYRVTVFKCGDTNCSENGKGVYLNHCIEGSCHEYIDSRDIDIKCPNSRYICLDCYSCCKTCIDSGNPNGWCPKCLTKLKVYQKNDERFVYCSTKNCFSISYEVLRSTKKKFLSKDMDIIPLRNN